MTTRQVRRDRSRMFIVSVATFRWIGKQRLPRDNEFRLKENGATQRTARSFS